MPPLRAVNVRSIQAGAAAGDRAHCLTMKVEHFALQVPDPVAMADWYVKHIGCSVARSGGEPSHARFLLDGAGSVMLEIYRNPRATVPDYNAMDPLLVHVAFLSDNLAADRDRLSAAGARVVEDLTTTSAGDHLVMLRDPWGVALQLVKRAAPMLPR
jgi:glyoxylase I family protein